MIKPSRAEWSGPSEGGAALTDMGATGNVEGTRV